MYMDLLIHKVYLQSLTRNSKKIVRSNQSCGGGSLPNVNNISSHTNSPTASFVKVK